MPQRILFLFLAFTFAICFLVSGKSVQAQDLSGKILLQVEQNGEAWYVNPEDSQRHFMGRPKDAFDLMRDLGTGITTEQLQNIPIGSIDALSGEDSDEDGLPDMFEDAVGTDKNNPDSDDDGYSDKEELKNGYDPNGSGRLSRNTDFAQAQAGKILLQVENNGEAWYVSPEDNKRYFLGRPADAFAVMRNLGMGITDSGLENIPQVEENKETNDSSSIEWTEEKTEYSRIEDLGKLNDKLYYVPRVYEDGRLKMFVVYDGVKQDDYGGSARGSGNINDKLAYIVKEGWLKWFVVYDGERKTTYDRIIYFKEVNGKLAYIAQEGGQMFVVYDDREQKRYDLILRLSEVDGKPAYLAKKDRQFFAVYNTQEQVIEYDNVYAFRWINDKPTYVIKKGNEEFMVHNGQEHSRYDKVFPPQEINGKLAYKAYDDWQAFVVYDGEEQKRYLDLGDIQEINGKLAYVASKKDSMFIVYDGEEQKKFHSVVAHPREIDNKLAYVASYIEELDKKFIVYNGEEHSKYDYVGKPREINNKLAYRAKKGNQEFIVYDGQESRGYDSIREVEILEVDGKLVFLAQKDGDWYIVREK